jgi:hypothetical protein
VGFQSNPFFLSSLPRATSRSHPRRVSESKLLKSGSYAISREPNSDLVVNHKKVSHDHGKLVVAEFSPDDVVRAPCSPASDPRRSAML